MFWATLVALLLGSLSIMSEDSSTILTGVAELAAVIAMFMVICTAEALN